MKRALAAFLVSAMTLGAVGIAASAGSKTASAATPLGNLIDFGDGSFQRAAGVNDGIYIDGLIPYNDNCLNGGIQDFLYPATDVYIVAAGSASSGAQLTDVNGTPNTVVATSTGVFVGEMIASTVPSGSLGEGTYDVVYDNCQDGSVDPEDAVWPDAISVTVPAGDLPPVSDSIRHIKDAAREQYVSWIQNQMALKALFLAEEAESYLTCLIAPSLECAADIAAGLFGITDLVSAARSRVEEQVMALVVNQTKNYAAIWQDPVDPAFDQLPVVVPEQVSALPAGGDPVQDALAALSEPLAEEGALSEALLHALERYQGAQAAGNADWALVQARAVADLSAQLATNLRASTAVTDLRDTVAVNVDALVADSAAGSAVINRIRTTGLTPDERRQLLNRGYTDEQIRTFESGYVADGQALSQGANQILAPFDQLVAARAAMANALDESATAWATLAVGLEGRADAPLPVVDAGGPYASGTDGHVALTAVATTPVGTAITAIEWDTDGDGQFDDAAGANPAVTLDRSRTLGARVTNDAGWQAVDFAVATVAPETVPVATATPAGRALSLTVGASQGFSVDVAGASSYQWTIDGEPAGSDAAFTFSATSEKIGAHVVSVVATRGHRSIAETWAVSVAPTDTDGDDWTVAADCDDTRADVHPGTFERLGNDLDDDCDPGTPDAPAGGLTGEVWTWGYSGGIGTGAGNQRSPIKLDALGDQVTAVESWNTGGYALMADSTVRSWGYNYNGELGNGTQTTSFTPVVVQNVGGGGLLSGVAEITGDHGAALARRQDGSVVAWGYNAAGQVGDGTNVAVRLVPTPVLDADTGLPLTGVAHVDVGDNSSYALMNDGTVKDWGYSICNGQSTFTQKVQASTNPLFGDDVVQLETGYYGGAIALLGDGTVLTCGGATPILGRPATRWEQANTPLPVTGLGAGSGVLDVSWGMEVAAVLKDDGSVWMWGANMNNELNAAGVPLGGYAYSPVQVPLPPGPPVVDIEMDYSVTMHAIRADGSVLVWGGNVYNSAGNGDDAYNVDGVQQVALPGQTIAVSNSVWNGIALVRPQAAGSAPLRPQYWISASVADTEIAEATGGSVALSLSQAASTDVVIQYDFNGASHSATIPVGQSSVLVPLAVADDAVDEDDAQLPITITDVSGGVRTARESGLVTVLDDDAAPALSIADVTVAEGDTSLTDVELTVSLSVPTSRDVVVDVATVPGTAQPGTDMYAYDGSLLIPAGESTGTVHVSVIGDRMLEGVESFSVALSNPQLATLADGSATATIIDDEPLAVTVSSPTTVEGDSNTTPAPFTISVAPAPLAGESVTLPYTIIGQSATVPGDVVAASGSLHFDSDAVTQIVTSDVVGDTDLEGPETYRVSFGSPVATDGRQVLVGDNPAAVILDDDQPPADGAAPIVDAGPAGSGDEGAPIALNGAVSDPDANDTVTTTWTFQAGPGVDAGATCTFTSAQAIATTITCNDDGTYVATLTATDAAGHTAADVVDVVVSNKAPVVQVVTPANASTWDIGSSLDLVAAVGDGGANDPVTCTINWGDGSTSAGTVGAGECRGAHTYLASGSPTVAVSVSDDDGASSVAQVGITINGTHVATVTGSGRVAMGSRCNTLSFTFTASSDGASVSGTLTMTVANHILSSNVVDSLTVSGFTATLTGTATWDGASNHRFVVTVEDRRRGGKKDPADTFAIRVTAPNGTVVFTKSGPLSSGSITVQA